MRRALRAFASGQSQMAVEVEQQRLDGNRPVSGDWVQERRDANPSSSETEEERRANASGLPQQNRWHFLSIVVRARARRISAETAEEGVVPPVT